MHTFPLENASRLTWTKFIWLPHSPGIMIKAWPFLSASLYASYFVVYWQSQMHIWTASGRITNRKMRISLSSLGFVLSLKKDKQETLPVITIVDILTNTNTCTVILRRLTLHSYNQFWVDMVKRATSEYHYVPTWKFRKSYYRQSTALCVCNYSNLNNFQW